MSTTFGGESAEQWTDQHEPASSSVTDRRKAAYWIILTILVLITVADIVLGAVLFYEFTEVYAQFVNQGTAFVYILLSSAILFVRWLPCCRKCRCFWDKEKLPTQHDESDSDGKGHYIFDENEEGDSGGAAGKKNSSKSKAPWYILVGIGLFNGSGNFLQAIGQPHTPALSQSLLPLLGVPLVMGLSALFLRKRSGWIAIVGAAVIVVGCGMSGLREVLLPSSSSGAIDVLWYSVLMYALAQIFLSGEKVGTSRVVGGSTFVWWWLVV